MSGSANCPDVIQLLSQACSQNADALHSAEKQLKAWETESGFYSTLLSIFSDHSVEVNVRWLAVLYFKNGVDKYWRKGAPNAISEEEKVSLRPRLIAGFSEPVSQVAMQLAVLIGKIARLDVPKYWPELIPTLIEAIKSQDALIRQRALLAFYHVTKSLSSRRLAHDRKVFEELTSNIFDFMLNLWNGYTDSAFTLISANTDQNHIMVSLEHSLLTLKVLRKLCVYGFQQLSASDAAMSFVQSCLQRIDAFANSAQSFSAAGQDSRRERMLRVLTKVLLDLLEYHPICCVPYINSMLQLAVTYNFTPSGKLLTFERFSVNTLNVMRSILRCEAYRPAKQIELTKDPATVEAYRLKMSLLTPDTLRTLTRCLICEYFPLKPEDLAAWDDDPEDFVSEDGGDSWRFSLEPCVENLYLTLIKEFRETLTPAVLDIVREFSSSADPEDLKSILQKDAVYKAVGLASFDFYEEIDFDSWFTNQLLPELKITGSNYRVLRRRIIWLCGCWVGVKMSHERRPALYEIILALLNDSEDMVVRLTAAKTLQSAIDDFEFQKSDFVPFLNDCFNRLYSLLKQVRECESKMMVLHVMSFVIERVGSSIRPYAAALLQYLPMLWEESSEYDMLRCAILNTLLQLVLGLGTGCTVMYPLLLPVLRLATDVNQPAHVYLMEDGLDLWEALLHCAPTPEPALLDLLTNMPALIDYSSEHLRHCIKIVEAYLLLGGESFMKNYSAPIISQLISALSDMRSEGIVMVMKLFETFVQALPDSGVTGISSVLPTLVTSIVQDDQLYPMEFSVYLSILARIALTNSSVLVELLTAVGAENGHGSEEVLGALLDVWLDKQDNITQMERKKLLALALVALLQTDNSVVLSRFGDIISAVVECLHDVCREDMGGYIDTLVRSKQHERPDDEEQDTQHEIRKRHLQQSDLVHSVDLRLCLMDELSRIQNNHGQQTFEQLMNSIDTEISNQLKDFLKNR